MAEEITFSDISTGASNDFENATKIARAMVTEYGMSNLGPIQYEQPNGSIFLGRDYLKDKNFSDQVALEIDKEVRNIIEGCYEKAKSVLIENRDLLKNIANYLLLVETLTKSDIDEINQTGKLKWVDDKFNNDEDTTEAATEAKPEETTEAAEVKEEASTETTTEAPEATDSTEPKEEEKPEVKEPEQKEEETK